MSDAQIPAAMQARLRQRPVDIAELVQAATEQGLDLGGRKLDAAHR